MKLFDIIGVLVVVCWVGVVGWVGYRELNGDEKAVSLDDIRLTEGDAWMVLNRENEEVGFVHETRTRIDDGWLLEYELAFQIDIASQKKLLESRTRATLDDKAYLRQFNADISSWDTSRVTYMWGIRETKHMKGRGDGPRDGVLLS